MLLGAVLGGVLGRYFGLSAPFWLGAVGVALVTAWMWRVLDNRAIAAEIEAARGAAASGSTVSR
jgi:predicted MFS family arabinose efflux permease